MYRNREFKHRTFLQSFSNSLKGLYYIFRHERNARRMGLMGIGAIAISFLLGLDALEWAIILLTIGLVIVCEIFNTLVEYLADIFRRKYDNRIRILKDIASAAPLFASCIALLIAALIFIPKISQNLSTSFNIL